MKRSAAPLERADNPSRQQRTAKQTTPRLSCELCRERKVKCDKREPCSNCVSSGVVCVPIHRQRLPRGRHANRLHRTPSSSTTTSLPGQNSASNAALGTVPLSGDLDQRMSRLEAIMAIRGPDTISDGTQEQSFQYPDPQTINSAPSSPATLDSAALRGTQRHDVLLQQPEHFWADTFEERHGLGGVMSSALGDAAKDPRDSLVDRVDGGMRVLGLRSLSRPSSIPQHFGPRQTILPPEIIVQLCQVYLQQVDPIIKILHRPSLSSLMLQGEGYLKYPNGHPSVEALKAAVCYVAASSMTENQYRTMFHASKSSIVADCQRACEDAMERSSLLATQDITVLQAFVLYIAARKTEDRSRAVWTLIAVAVRVAKALHLHQDAESESGKGKTFFDQQMRKRLWLTICLMDLQASFAQSSEPLVGSEEAASSLMLPAHVNDSDFDPSTTQPIPNREGLTDTTFSLVTFHVQLGGRLLSYAARREKSGSASTPSTSHSATLSELEIRQQHARRFEREALGLLHFCDPETSVYAWFTWHGTQCLVAAVRLSVLQPPSNNPHQQGGPSRPGGGEQGDAELLRLALVVLEKGQLMHADARGEGFRWYITVPWHALAAAVSECCTCSDVVLLRRAWPVVEAAFRRHEPVLVARFGEGGGPQGSLMRRARERYTALFPSSDAGAGPTISPATASGSSHTSAPHMLASPLTAPYNNLAEPTSALTSAPSLSRPPSSSDLAFRAVLAPDVSSSAMMPPLPQQQLSQQQQHIAFPSLSEAPCLPVMTDAAPTVDSDYSAGSGHDMLGPPEQQAWGWDDPMMDVSSLDGFAGLGMFFCGNNLGAYYGGFGGDGGIGGAGGGVGIGIGAGIGAHSIGSGDSDVA